MHISVSARRLPAMLAAAALVLAGCGPKTDNAQVATLSSASTVAGSGDATSTSLSQADTEKAMLSFAACMRDKGINVADPTFDANGNVQGGFLRPGNDGSGNNGVDFRSQEFQDAFQACQPNLQGVQFGGPGGGGRFDRTAIQNAFNSFTKCLRDKGQQVDDITLPQGGGPGGGGFGGGQRNGANNGGSSTTTGANGSGGSTANSGNGNGGGFTGGPGAGGPPPGGGGPGGPGRGGFNPTDRIIQQLGLDANDATVKAAVEACQPVLQAAFNQAGGSTTTTTK